MSPAWDKLRVVGFLNQGGGKFAELRNCALCDGTLGAPGYTVLRSGLEREIIGKVREAKRQLIRFRTQLAQITEAKSKKAKGYQLTRSERYYVNSEHLVEQLEIACVEAQAELGNLEWYMQDIQTFEMAKETAE